MLEPALVADASPGPVYPVTRAEIKAQTRIDGTDEDDYIDALIAAATARLNGWNGLLGGVVLVTQTWRASYDRFPAGRRLELPMTPVQSITSVVYADKTNTDQTLAASRYSLHEDDGGALLWLNADQDAWPDTYDDRPDAVRVTMLCGYGDDASDVPEEIRHAIRMLVAHWHQNREPVAANGTPTPIPLMFEAMIADVRRARFA